jgi:hypothetical protein
MTPALVVEVLQSLLPDGWKIVPADWTADDPDELLVEAQVADELHVEVSTLRKWRTTGEGPGFCKVPGFRAPQYRRKDLNEWKASLKGYHSTVEYKQAG